MKSLFTALLTILFVSALWVGASYANENNELMKKCVASTSDFNEAAACYHKVKTKWDQEQLADLRKFLKDNPRYRYPGQSDNRCFGKVRELAFESVSLSAGPWGFSAGVSYKDTIKPCIIGPFETDPYDKN